MNKYASEFLGTMFLVATVIGSGIMAETLSGGNVALALLANTIATGAILYVIINMFGPISGAHFNPVVSMVMMMQKALPLKDTFFYILFQILGGIIGAWLAHFMFDLDILQLSEKSRSGIHQYGAEVIASFGLLMTILMGVRYRAEAVPAMVGLYITAAYWFTASTSFANPAVTIARTFSNSFAGIHYADTGPFILAQVIGAVLAMLICKMLIEDQEV